MSDEGPSRPIDIAPVNGQRWCEPHPIRCAHGRLVAGTARDGQSTNDQRQEYHHEDKEKDLRDGDRRAGYSGKSQDARDQADDKKDKCPM